MYMQKCVFTSRAVKPARGGVNQTKRTRKEQEQAQPGPGNTKSESSSFKAEHRIPPRP